MNNASKEKSNLRKRKKHKHEYYNETVDDKENNRKFQLHVIDCLPILLIR